MKSIAAGFCIGAFLGAAILYFTVISSLRSQNAQLSSQQSVQTGNAQSQLKNLQQQIEGFQSKVQSLTTEKETCRAKFERATVLYDIGLLGAETRAWVIPADVEPKAVGLKRGTFSHYDPKTQVETVHIKPTGGTD